MFFIKLRAFFHKVPLILCFVLKNCLSKAASYYAPFTPVSCDTLMPNSDFMSDLPMACRNARKSTMLLLMPVLSGFAGSCVTIQQLLYKFVMYHFSFMCFFFHLFLLLYKHAVSNDFAVLFCVFLLCYTGYD